MLLKNFIISTTFFSLSAKRNASLNSRSLQFLSFSTKKGARKDKKQVAEQKSVTVFLNAKRLNEKKSASLPGTDGAAKSNKNLIKNMAPAGAGQKNESAAFASLPKPRATRLKPGSIVKGGRASDSFFEPGEALPFQASRSKPKNLWRPSARSQEFDNVKKIPSSEKIKFTSDTSRAPVVKKKRVLIRTGKWEPERITSTSPHYGRIHDGAAMVKKFQEEKERAARRARPGYDDFEYRMAYKYGVRERIRFNEKKPAKAKRLPALAAPTTAVAGVVAQNLSSGNVLLQNQQQSASPTLAVSAAKTPALAPTAAINNRAPALKAAPFKPGTAIIKSFNNKNDNRQRAEPYKPLTYFGGDTPLSVLEPLKPNPVAPRSSTQKNKNKYSSKKGKKRADW